MTTDLPRAALIDLDDTIIDDSGNVESCWAEACSAAEPQVPGLDPLVLQRAVREYADLWWSDSERHRRGRLDLRAATGEIVTEVMGRLGHETSAASAIANHYRDLREERTNLFPGAIEALERLRSGGVRLAMVTNGSATAQRAKIERFGLAPYFDCIVVEGEFGQGKPNLAVYEHALKELGATAQDTWCVGDNLEWDVGAPQSLGIFGIWHDVRREGLPEGATVRPDRIVHALSELV